MPEHGLTTAVTQAASEVLVVQNQLALLTELMNLVGSIDRSDQHLQYIFDCYIETDEDGETLITLRVLHKGNSKDIDSYLEGVATIVRKALGGVRISDEPNGSNIPRFTVFWKEGVVIKIGH